MESLVSKGILPCQNLDRHRCIRGAGSHTFTLLYVIPLPVIVPKEMATSDVFVRRSQGDGHERCFCKEVTR